MDPASHNAGTRLVPSTADMMARAPLSAAWSSRAARGYTSESISMSQSTLSEWNEGLYKTAFRSHATETLVFHGVSSASSSTHWISLNALDQQIACPWAWSSHPPLAGSNLDEDPPLDRVVDTRHGQGEHRKRSMTISENATLSVVSLNSACHLPAPTILAR